MRRRRYRHALTGLLLAAGAPLGLLAMRASRTGGLPSLRWVATEIAADRATYAYMALSTAVAFAAFGYALGGLADRLEALSSTDALTGLQTRRLAQERLDVEVARARRQRRPVSVVLFDLDGLKGINDASGHGGGDAALRRAAVALRLASRATDVVARWGGDEFLLVAPQAAEREGVELAERVRTLLAEGDRPGEPPLRLSAGVAVLEPWVATVDREELVRRADEALYEAKRLGRNRVFAASSLRPERAVSPAIPPATHW